jgi:hypothetical protein
MSFGEGRRRAGHFDEENTFLSSPGIKPRMVKFFREFIQRMTLIFFSTFIIAVVTVKIIA